MITIDGTRLYVQYQGTMLVDIRVDVNYQLFPLALFIIEGRSNNAALVHDLHPGRVPQQLDLCMISNRYKGTIAVMNNEYLGWGLRGCTNDSMCVTCQ